MILLLALLGCYFPSRQEGEWTRIPSPNGYTDVECYVWDDRSSISFSGPICLHACSPKD